MLVIMIKVTGKRFAHAMGPLVKNVKITYDLERERAGVPGRFFHVKLTAL